MGETRRIPIRRVALSGGAVLLGSAALGLFVLDRAASDFVERFRPELERSLAQPLGHPVRIGAYDGLRPFGIGLGPSRVLSLAKDRSEISLQGLEVRFEPLASLRLWRPVLSLDIQGARIQLRRNAEGRYWTPGPVQTGGSLPAVRLNLRFLQDAQVSIEPQGQTVLVGGRAAVDLADRWFGSSAELTWSDSGGSLDLQAKGKWDRTDMVLTTRMNGLQLGRLASFMPLSAGTGIAGRLDGDLGLTLRDGKVACRGGVQLGRVELSSGAAAEPLRASRLKLSCKDDTITLEPSRLQWDNWSVQAAGSVTPNRAVDLRLDLLRSAGQDKVKVLIDGPWASPRWRVNGELELPEPGPVRGPLTLTGQLTTPWTNPAGRSIRVDDLLLKAPGARLRLQGDLLPDLTLRSTEFAAEPEVWQSIPALARVLGQAVPIQGSLQTSGTPMSPELQLQLSQASNALLENWTLQASWSQPTGLAVLDRFDSPALQAAATLPLSLRDGRLQSGDLQAEVTLREIDLQRLTPLFGTPMGGALAARGTLNGPLQSLRPDLALTLRNPRVGPLQVPELWRGHLRGVLGQGGRLEMESNAPGQVTGSLQAQFGADLWPTHLQLVRDSGQVSLRGVDRRFSWTADRFVLDGLQLALPPSQQFEAVSGDLTGAGDIAFGPFGFEGQLTVDEPMTRGISLETFNIQGRLADGRFQADGDLRLPDGEVRFQSNGILGGALSSRAEVSGVNASWLLDLIRQLRSQGPLAGLDPGRAQDLGSFVIETFGGSIDGQLKALARSREALQAYALANPTQQFDPRDLQGRVDAVIALEGASLQDLELDLEARGHLWLDGHDRDLALQMEPVIAVIRGPIRGGEGEFALRHLPFSLMALFVPMPPALKGAMGVTGRYRFGRDGASIESSLAFEDAVLGSTPLVLDRRAVNLDSDGLALDLALRSQNSTEPITVRGAIPLAIGGDLDVQIESHGDALRVLTELAGQGLTVDSGTTDLRLILRGTLSEPRANGFLVIRDGDIQLAGQQIRQLNASMVFDFNRLDVQKLSGKLAAGGTLSGSGAIGLFESRDEKTPLTIELIKAHVRQSIVEVMADARVRVEGSLRQPVVGGSVDLNNGVIRPRQSLLSRVRRSLSGPGGSGLISLSADASAEPVSLNSLIEQQWSFKEPLVLFGPGAAAASPTEIQGFLPNLPAIRFRNLRLKLGPDLAVRMLPFVSFRGGGQLLLNGPLDPTLQVRGLIRLNSGRISLFSTTFVLDPKAPNAAVFTPSMRLVPYVDIAMRSRVSDSVQANAPSGATTNIFETNGQGAQGFAGGQLRLVKVTVQASGAANRLLQNLELRSSPPMSQSHLVSMIGGNSLAGLDGGNAGAALATVLGQTLLSPVLGTLSDVMGERLHVALYPTYVTPAVTSEQDRTSGRVPPTFTVVSEIGLDVTDQFDFSVLATPDNSEVPPQVSVSYQVNPNTTLSGSVDADGTWQSQFRLFFRF